MIFPEDIPDDVVRRRPGGSASPRYQSLELSGYARVDMRLRPPKDSRGWDYPIIEVNPNCWIEKRGEFAAGARKHGLSYPELLEKIIELALRQPPAAS